MFYFYSPPSVLGALMFFGLLLYLLIAARGPKEGNQSYQQYWKERSQKQRAKNRELWKNMSKTDRQLYYFGIVCFLLAFLIFAFIGIHAMLH